MAHPFLLFYVGGSCFALEAAMVHEVLTEVALVRVPGVDPSVAGVTFVRGRVHAVLDTARLLGLAEEPSALDRVLLVAAAGIEAGLLVTRTGDLTPLDLEKLAPLPAELAGIPGTERVAMGVVSQDYDGNLVGITVLDGESLLRVAKERACP
jgi:chemotaxis signal transduction protein